MAPALTDASHGPLKLLARLVTPVVSVAEGRGLLDDVGLLLGAERGVVEGVVGRRRREFITGRVRARQALAVLGSLPQPILQGASREPVWPVGVVGSVTHCTGYVAAAVAWAEQVRGLGFDAEPAQALPKEVLPLVGVPEELRHLRALAAGRPQVPWDRLLFSAKEAVYKLWFPMRRTWLGFGDVSITFDASSNRFSAHLRRAALAPAIPQMPRTLEGRYIATDGLLVTAVVLPGSEPSS